MSEHLNRSPLSDGPEHPARATHTDHPAAVVAKLLHEAGQPIDWGAVCALADYLDHRGHQKSLGSKLGGESPEGQNTQVVDLQE